MEKRTIAIWAPKWLYYFDTGITIFIHGLYQTIRKSEKYKLLKITPKMCNFQSIEESQEFVKKHNIAFVMYHDVRRIPAIKSHEKGLNYLETLVPFLNPESAHVSDDKIETKKILRKLNIPVLPDFSIRNKKQLTETLEANKLYVAKPHNAESGNGVKLIKMTGDDIFEYFDTKWRKLRVEDTQNGIMLSRNFNLLLFTTIAFYTFAFSMFFERIIPSYTFFLLSILGLGFFLRISKKMNLNFTYNPLMLEPFFGDNTEEFYCLRCTVLDGKVLESAKKANKKNITPNISHGGKASNIELTPEQKEIAISATKAVGAIVCEINVGPIGVYCQQTKVNVGKILAEYAMKYCDETHIK